MLRVKRRRKLLGEVEQVRTGTVRLDWDEINRATSQILAHFDKCASPSAEPFYSPQYAKVELDVFDPKAKTTNVAQVSVAPLPNMQAMVEGYAETLLNKRTGVRKTMITLTPARGLCTSRSDWASALRSVLAHEVTHASDPMIGRRKKAYSIEAVRSGQQSPCVYLNDPGEVKAHLNEVRAELRRPDARRRIRRLQEKGIIKNPADALRLSQRWGQIQACYTGKNRRRFYKMAALEL